MNIPIKFKNIIIDELNKTDVNTIIDCGKSGKHTISNIINEIKNETQFGKLFVLSMYQVPLHIFSLQNKYGAIE